MKNKFYHILVVLLMFFSCTNIKPLVYSIPNVSAMDRIEGEIQQLLAYKKNVFIQIDGSSDCGYKVDIIPTNDLNSNKILNLNIKNTNRILEINSQKYYVFFELDSQLGIIRRKATKEEEKDADENNLYIITKQHHIYDNASTLYFDKDWNFVNKKSLVIKNK